MSAQSNYDLVVEYVAGTLTRPAKALVDAHLEIVPDNRVWVHNLEAIAGHSLDTSDAVSITNSSSMIDAIVNSAPEDDALSVDQAVSHETSKSDEWMPASLREFIGLPTKDIPWRMKMPGVYIYKMDDVDGCEVSLLRIKPGVSIPTHTHEGRELTLVLKGSFNDGEGQYARGDVSVADQAVDHKPLAGTSEECICLVVNDAPLRFTGPFARIISSILPS